MRNYLIAKLRSWDDQNKVVYFNQTSLGKVEEGLPWLNLTVVVFGSSLFVYLLVMLSQRSLAYSTWIKLDFMVSSLMPMQHKPTLPKIANSVDPS